MDGMNKVILIGVLGQDAELRHTQGGQAVATVRMATNESYFDKHSQQRQQRTEWHTVVVWGKRAEALQPYLTKGTTIFVEGRLQTRSWEDKSGGRRYSTEVVANELGLLGGRARRDQPDYDPNTGEVYDQQRRQDNEYAARDAESNGETPDDIPF